MKLNWTITSAISGLIGGLITYGLTQNWKISLIISIVLFIVVIQSNPKRRYMKVFYIALFPLISNIYFNINSKTENLDIQAGLKELDPITVAFLGSICLVCLLLDYLERSGKWKGNLISTHKNSNKNISGNNISINQTINKKDYSTND